MGWFEDEAHKMHKKEIKSLRDELSENSEAYVNEVRDSGYDNIEDYERDVNRRAGFGCLIAIVGIAVVFVGWLVIHLYK
jgi:hypothetical protein